MGRKGGFKSVSHGFLNWAVRKASKAACVRPSLCVQGVRAHV